jgi:hypothetical protein
MVYISFSGMVAIENPRSDSKKPKSVTMDVSIPIGGNQLLLGALQYFNGDDSITFQVDDGEFQLFQMEATVRSPDNKYLS